MKHVLRLILLGMIIVMMGKSSVLAQEEPSYDEINEVAKELNCPTCSGINLADCRTQTCEQWRDQISDLLSEGYTKPEVVDYFSTRYGDQVLQEPPRQGFTLFLWVLPVIVLILGAIFLVIIIRNWTTPQTETASVNQESAEDDYLRQVERDLDFDRS